MRQYLRKAFCPAADTPQKDDNIPVSGRPVTFLILVPDRHAVFFAGQLPDFSGYHAGLQLPGRIIGNIIVQPLKLTARRVDKEQLRIQFSLFPSFIRLEGRPRMKSRLIRIFNIPKLLCHNPEKDIIDAH